MTEYERRCALALEAKRQAEAARLALVRAVNAQTEAYNQARAVIPAGTRSEEFYAAVGFRPRKAGKRG